MNRLIISSVISGVVFAIGMCVFDYLKGNVFSIQNFLFSAFFFSVAMLLVNKYILTDKN